MKHNSSFDALNIQKFIMPRKHLFCSICSFLHLIQLLDLKRLSKDGSQVLWFFASAFHQHLFVIQFLFCMKYQSFVVTKSLNALLQEISLSGVDSLGFDLRVCAGTQVQTLRFSFSAQVIHLQEFLVDPFPPCETLLCH